VGNACLRVATLVPRELQLSIRWRKLPNLLGTIWLHVDAAFLAQRSSCPNSLDDQRSGIRDSFVFNPHKWLFKFRLFRFYVKDKYSQTTSVLPEYRERTIINQ
jgi:glutamate/tyrosine decarboxylase-like PLP-dependent enzyme